jgi:hypothetical protein
MSEIDNEPSTVNRTILQALVMLLIPLVLFVCVDGFAALLNHPVFFQGGPRDLHRRWVEGACVREGKSPYAVMDGRLPPPAAGRPMDADYPPWALVMGLIFTLPSWPASCVLFAAWNVFAVLFLGWWAYSLGNRQSKLTGLVILLGVLAIGVNRVVIDVGQYTVLMCAFLAASLVLYQKKRPWLAGLALGISLLKFNVSLPFCVCFLFVGAFRTLITACTCLLVTSLASWSLIHTQPWTAFKEAAADGTTFATSSPTLLKGLIAVGIPDHLAVIVSAVLVMLAGAALMWKRRRESMVVLFAIACYTARLWTYHLWYDDLMMLFLLAALGERAANNQRIGPARLYQATFLAVGLSLWFTLGSIFRWPVVLLQTAVWTFGLLILVSLPGEPNAGGKQATVN